MNRMNQEYGEHGHYGKRDSSVHIRCTVKGQLRPPFPTSIPEIDARVGIDLNPLDIETEEDTRWLQALIWPEHEERQHIVTNAISIAQRSPPQLIAGDAIEHLKAVAQQIPEDTALCVFNTHTLYQLSSDQRNEFYHSVAELGEERDVYWLSCEASFDIAMPIMHLHRFEEGVKSAELLARYHAHGKWIEWLQKP